jgi:glutamate-5-semialdehyde dehydrogenase
MQVTTEVLDLVAACRRAARQVANLSTAAKNRALQAMAEALLQHEAAILAANAVDVANAEAGGMSAALIDRLRLDPKRLRGMADALREVIALPDPVGEMAGQWTRPNGLQVGQMRVPLGVILFIYESRPNVTSDAAGLCFKSGNGVVLRGGKEAFHSNAAIVAALQGALQAEHLPVEAVTFIPTTDRAALLDVLALNQHIDLVIPRGGEGLIRFVDEHSRIPVIKHYKGVCHLFVDEEADFDRALHLLIDGKVSRPSVCNALETLLVHEAIADTFLPLAGAALRNKQVVIRGDERTRSLVPDAEVATEDDYYAEYLDYLIAVRVVPDLDAALAHIARYGSMHTEVIATNNLAHARRFVREVDASAVMVNASSRFNDGGELGLGAEIGISTTKLHAYGPMGLEALTTKKFVVMGDGQTRQPITL